MEPNNEHNVTVSATVDTTDAAETPRRPVPDLPAQNLR